MHNNGVLFLRAFQQLSIESHSIDLRRTYLQFSEQMRVLQVLHSGRPHSDASCSTVDGPSHLRCFSTIFLQRKNDTQVGRYHYYTKV